jgi:hypothetical protein
MDRSEEIRNIIKQYLFKHGFEMLEYEHNIPIQSIQVNVRFTANKNNCKIPYHLSVHSIDFNSIEIIGFIDSTQILKIKKYLLSTTKEVKNERI